MLSDEDKARIKEEEEVKMEVRASIIKDNCCHGCRYCGRHRWLPGLGLLLILAIVIAAFCHHGHSYHYIHATQNEANQTTSK
jgi:hypothetical protein